MERPLKVFNRSGKLGTETSEQIHERETVNERRRIGQ
jgi:hypothetical protein